MRHETESGAARYKPKKLTRAKTREVPPSDPEAAQRPNAAAGGQLQRAKRRTPKCDVSVELDTCQKLTNCIARYMPETQQSALGLRSEQEQPLNSKDCFA